MVLPSQTARQTSTQKLTMIPPHQRANTTCTTHSEQQNIQGKHHQHSSPIATCGPLSNLEIQAGEGGGNGEGAADVTHIPTSTRHAPPHGQSAAHFSLGGTRQVPTTSFLRECRRICSISKKTSLHQCNSWPNQRQRHHTGSQYVSTQTQMQDRNRKMTKTRHYPVARERRPRCCCCCCCHHLNESGPTPSQVRSTSAHVA